MPQEQISKLCPRSFISLWPPTDRIRPNCGDCCPLLWWSATSKKVESLPSLPHPPNSIKLAAPPSPFSILKHNIVCCVQRCTNCSHVPCAVMLGLFMAGTILLWCVSTDERTTAGFATNAWEEELKLHMKTINCQDPPATLSDYME